MRLLRQAGREDGVLGPGILEKEFAARQAVTGTTGKEAESVTGENRIICPGEKEGAGLPIHMPWQAEYIIETLRRSGFEAYIVGGCVRDSLLGKQPGDWDITTSALPKQVKALFHRTVDTGIAHGTVTVMRGKEAYEVTTYRIDGEYEDNRHPKSVAFTSSLEEDLRRRDFTINAMAYNSHTGLIDLFDGIGDLERGLIRCVGNPGDRFGEDALRILRALRFSAQLGFEIEASTKTALRALAPGLAHVSKERIQTEITKLLLSDHPESVRRVFEDGLAPFVSPAFSAVVPEKIVIDNRLPARRHLRWAALLCHQTEAEAEQVLKELKLDNNTILRVRLLVRWWNQPAGAEETSLRRTMSRMSEEQFDDLMTFKRYMPGIPESAGELERIGDMTGRIRDRGDCVGLKTLALSGRDLIGLGMKPGPAMGDMLEALLEIVLECPEKNEKDLLTGELKNLLKKIT